MNQSNQDKVVDVLNSAGKMLVDVYRNPKIISQKYGFHYTIKEDLEIDNYIFDELHRLIPDAGYFSEEKQINIGSGHYWIVDAIEGTTNYSRQIPFFATQCALVEENKIIFSTICAPLLECVYIANDQRCQLNGSPISINNKIKLTDSVMSIGKGSSSASRDWLKDIIPAIINKVRTVRLFGSTGLELALISDNQLNLHINSGSHLYDLAAGIFIVKQSGGKVVNFEGKPWTLEDSTVIAGSETSVNQALEVIQQLIVLQ